MVTTKRNAPVHGGVSRGASGLPSRGTRKYTKARMVPLHGIPLRLDRGAELEPMVIGTGPDATRIAAGHWQYQHACAVMPEGQDPRRFDWGFVAGRKVIVFEVGSRRPQVRILAAELLLAGAEQVDVLIPHPKHPGRSETIRFAGGEQ